MLLLSSFSFTFPSIYVWPLFYCHNKTHPFSSLTLHENFANVVGLLLLLLCYTEYGWAIGKLMATRKQIKLVSVSLWIWPCFVPWRWKEDFMTHETIPGHCSLLYLAIKKQASVKYCQLICETTAFKSVSLMWRCVQKCMSFRCRWWWWRG